MASEYIYPLVQDVAQGANIVFLDGDRICSKKQISHRADSGVFRLKGAANCCRTLYRVTFDANVAIATKGTIEPITVALQEDGETINSAVATVTPAAIEDFWNVSMNTFVSVPCGCCVTIAIKNISENTAISVRNANIIFERVA